MFPFILKTKSLLQTTEYLIFIRKTTSPDMPKHILYNGNVLWQGDKRLRKSHLHMFFLNTKRQNTKQEMITALIETYPYYYSAIEINTKELLMDFL